MTKKRLLPLVLVLAAVGLVLFFRNPAVSVENAREADSPSVEELSKRLDRLERDVALLDSDFAELKGELEEMIGRLEKTLDRMEDSGSDGASKEELDNKARGFVKSILDKFMGLVGLLFDRAEQELDKKLDEPSRNDPSEKEI